MNDNVSEPNLVEAMSPLLSPSSRTIKALSSIFDNKKALVLAEAVEKEMKIKSGFPEKHQYSGYLSIRTDDDNQWHRKYFVLSNNFLFGGDTQYSTKLSVCISLEGCNTKLTLQSSDMTFELNKYYFRANSPQLCKEWILNIERASTLSIYDIYRFRYELGCSSSSSSKVIAAKHKITNQEFAIKIMNKKKCNDKKTLQREINILKKLKSPYIVELCDLFETSKYLYIVMELCKGGELFDQIANMDYLNGDRYTEKDCIGIMHQLASGVQYMHNMGIVHRDLKPENILCVEPNSIKKIKIADFGISAIIDPNRLNGNGIKRTRPKSIRSNKGYHSNCNSSSFDALNVMVQNQNNMMKTRVGTLSYTAPEIIKYKPYDERVDYWSLGVIMYILVCGYPPFDGENDYDLSDEIINNEVQFDEEDWTHVGQETQDLIERLLLKNPRRRANCQDIIEHSWKIDVKNSGFMKAHNKFKQTVFKRKIISRSRANTANTANTEKIVNNNNNINNNNDNGLPLNSFDERMKNLMELNINALDDSVIKQKRNNKMNAVQFDSEQKENQINSWCVGSNDKKQSKTTECLYLEHSTQINPRKDTIYLNENIIDDLPDFPCLDLLSYSNRSSMISNTTISMTTHINKTKTNTGNTINLSSESSIFPSHSPQNSFGSYTRSRLSCLSSKSFLESFTNKRSSISKYKRKRNGSQNRNKMSNNNNSIHLIPQLNDSWSIMEEKEENIEDIHIINNNNNNNDNDHNEENKDKTSKPWPRGIKVHFYQNDDDDEEDDDIEKEINNYAIPNFPSIDSPSPLTPNIPIIPIYNESNPTSPENDNGIDLNMLYHQINDNDNHSKYPLNNHETHKIQISFDEFVDSNYLNIKQQNDDNKNCQFSSI